MAEKYLHIWRTDQKTPHKTKCGETSCRQKKNSFQPLLPIFDPAAMTTKTRGTIQQKKPQNQSIRDRTTFGIQYCKISVKVRNEKTLTQNLTSRWKELILNNFPTLFTNAMKRISVSDLLHLSLNNAWTPGPRLACISKKSNFFLFSQATKKFQHEQNNHWAASLTDSNKNIQNTTSAEKRSRTWKDS